MTHQYDGSSLDLERALVRYMAERRVSRRQLLQRIAAVGATAALAPVVAACTTGGAASASPSAAAVASSAPTATTGPTASPEPTPAPTPESELLIYNYSGYLAPEVKDAFEKQVRRQGHRRAISTPTTSCIPKIQAGNSGYDLTLPDRHRHPRPRRTGPRPAAGQDTSSPNIVNLAEEWLHPAYDPDHDHSMPYMWWTTGVAYDSKPLPRAADQPGGTVGSAVHEPHHDARRPARGIRSRR